MQDSKKTPEGFRERLDLLSSIDGVAAAIYKRAMHDHGRAVEKDDVLDAIAAAFTALPRHENLNSLRTLPNEPERDVHGLPMEMVYRLPRGG